jgi:glycosyltransferase involved in cell wall biosynthesis
MACVDIAALDQRFAAEEEFLGNDKPVNRVEPLVSVVVPTYQHQAYVGQCLDSILMQQTSFPYEIILGEDESSDGTRDVCVAYARAHPDRIRLFLRSRARSVYSAGAITRSANGIWCRRSARGEFVALCEGDDYWIAHDKLQKQVDFLEAHPDCSLSFHNALRLEQGAAEVTRPVYEKEMQAFYDAADVLAGNFVYTAAVMYRRAALPDPLPAWYYRMPFLDWPTFILIAQKGRLGYLGETMSVYRVHAGGSWSRLTEGQRMEQTIRAAEILQGGLSCACPLAQRALAKLPHRIAWMRSQMFAAYLEKQDFHSASKHAQQLLTYKVHHSLKARSLTRADVLNMCWLMSVIVRHRSPRLWNVLRNVMKGRTA